MDYNEIIRQFLRDMLEKDAIEDIGYMLVPDDERLNNFALMVIKSKFRDYVGEYTMKQGAHD